MKGKRCGCTTETCGCCEGTQSLTPESVINRPGLNALSYRVGTHGAFLESMKARLSNMTVNAPGTDGQTLETLTPLQELTTRDSGDFSIALLDGWATIADVITFYQERIANEGYLRTATERRSVLELARLVGYKLRPGVAATVYLAYTIDPNQTTPAQIPAGARSQSIPGPGELPQSFETSEPLEARPEWNNLQIRLTQPQNITLANAMAVESIYVGGANINLKSGDSLLLVFGEDGNPSVLRTVQGTTSQPDSQQTQIQLQPTKPLLLAALAALVEFRDAIKSLSAANTESGKRILSLADDYLTQTYLGTATPEEWVVEFFRYGVTHLGDFVPAYTVFENKLSILFKTPPFSSGSGATTNPSLFAASLLLPLRPQVSGSVQLSRSLSAAFQAKADSNPQLLVKFAPKLGSNFYTAWANAKVNDTPAELQGVFVLRAEASLFGANAAKEVSYDGNVPTFTEWPLDAGETTKTLFLDQTYEAIQPNSYVLIQDEFGNRAVKIVSGVQTLQRAAYGISGKTTQLTFADDWRSDYGNLAPLRSVLVRGQSEELTLDEQPISVDVTGQEIPLDDLYDSLKSGRWIILSGERADIPGVSAVESSELLMISNSRQDFDSTLPGDKTHTTLTLATSTAYSYKRDTVKIFANVVKATNGETRNETLGNGDGSQEFQPFALKQSPLTFVAASNPSGAESTLEVFVNNVQWHEADTLAGLGPKDHSFITKIDDAGKTTVIFGSGAEGARVPTGMANVTSIYRNGIGIPGNVKAEQISLLQTRPLGVKAVINPLAASGGADPENRDQARENAPLAVMSLDRLVSVQDYADFARTFAGIGKAAARMLSDTKRQLVHLTIAGQDDIPTDETSDLYQNLFIALRRFGDPDLPVQVQVRELVVLVLSANVRLAPDYQWDFVAPAIRSTLLDTFGFQKRALGQPALLSEIICAIQNVAGVEYVDVDAFGGVPEKKPELDGNGKPTGERVLLSLSDIAATVQQIVNPRQALILKRNAVRSESVAATSVEVNLADFEDGTLRPAQLAIFTDAVPDTLILNQVP